MSKSLKSTIDKNSATLMVVDSLNLAFRWKHQGKFDFLDEYHRTVDSLAKSYGAGKVIVAADCGSSSYRRALYPEYKQNRKDKQVTQTPEEQKEFELFFEEYLNVLEAYKEATNYPVLRFDKVEADDIAAYIVKTKNRYSIDKVVLISSDRDWDLLISDSVMRFSYVTRKETTLENWHEHYECEPWQYISIKCLQGDSGDNIPGVPGIGPVKAQQLVKQYSSALDIAEALPIPSKYKYIQNLNTFGSTGILLNYQLMDLVEFCDAALGPNNCAAIDKALEKYLC